MKKLIIVLAVIGPLATVGLYEIIVRPFNQSPEHASMSEGVLFAIPNLPLDRRNEAIQRILNGYRFEGEWRDCRSSIGALSRMVIHADLLQEPVVVEMPLGISTKSSVYLKLATYYPRLRKINGDEMRLHDIATYVVNREPSEWRYFLQRLDFDETKLELVRDIRR